MHHHLHAVAVAKSIVNVTISALTVEKTMSKGHL
jgi:hypothetical protein